MFSCQVICVVCGNVSAQSTSIIKLCRCSHYDTAPAFVYMTMLMSRYTRDLRNVCVHPSFIQTTHPPPFSGLLHLVHIIKVNPSLMGESCFFQPSLHPPRLPPFTDFLAFYTKSPCSEGLALSWMGLQCS